jgi:hypothetical protein
VRVFAGPDPCRDAGNALGDVGGKPRGLVERAIAAETPGEVSAGVPVGVLRSAIELADQPRPHEQFPDRHGDQLVWIIGTVGAEQDRYALQRDVEVGPFRAGYAPGQCFWK